MARLPIGFQQASFGLQFRRMYSSRVSIVFQLLQLMDCDGRFHSNCCRDSFTKYQIGMMRDVWIGDTIKTR